MTAYGKQPDKTLVGKKIKLIKLKSLKLDITPDTTGVIESVDSITGKIHVKWDTDLESTLTPGVDEYEIQFADEDFSKYMGTKGESYIIDKSGQGERELFYLIRAKSPHHMVDMFFSSKSEAEKFASKKGLVIKDKIEEKYVDGGVIGESEVLTYLKTKHGVEESQITVGKDNKGKWNILIIDSELDPKEVSKWEKEVNKVFTKGKIVHKTISFDANNHITYYNGELTFQNIKDLTGITPVKIQNIEYLEINDDVDPFIKWSATELKNMFGYDIQNIIFSKKVLSDNEIEILDAYAMTDDELHSFKYSPVIHAWYSIEEDENREKYGSDEEYGNGGSISNELENFDLNELDPFETMQYNHFVKNLTKAESLQILINNVEGDYSQLSPKLAELAEIQNPYDEAANGANLQSPIEQVLRKHFQKTNREGMGFLESNIIACAKDLELLCSKPVKHSSRDIDNWILSQMEKKKKIGFGDNVHVPEINKSGIVVEIQGEAVKVKFIDGSTGEFEKKDVHKIAKNGKNVEYPKVQYKGDDRAFWYVVGEEGDNYILVFEEKLEHWKNASKIERREYFEDIDAKSQFEPYVEKAKHGKILNPPLTQISIGELVPVSEIKSGIVIDKQNDIIKVRFVDGSTGEFNNKDIQALIIDSMSKLRFHALYSELNEVQKKEIDRLIEHPEKKEVGDTIVFNGFDTRGRRERSTVLIHSIDEDHRNFQGINNLGIIRTYPIGHLKESYIIGINKNKKAKHGALLHHTFTYQNTPDEKWEVEYEMDRDFPIISTITINGQQTDIDSYDEDIIMKVSMEAYQDYIDNLMTSGEYSREDFAANGKEVESYESYDDFVKKNIGEKKFVIVVGSGGSHQPLDGATKESIDVMFKDLVFHNFMDINFKSNYCPDEYEKEYIQIVKKFYNELINNPQAFKDFWSKYIVKSGHYNGKYAIQSPIYTKEGKRIEYVQINGNWIHAVKLDGEWIPQEVENYPDIVFHKYKSEISKGLKDAYSEYLKEYAGQDINLAANGKEITKEEYVQLLQKYDRLTGIYEDETDEKVKAELTVQIEETANKIHRFERKDEYAADGKNIPNKNIRTIVFKHKNNPSLNVTVKAYPNMQITEIENPRHVRFPFSVGQIMNMGHQTWACNNNYLVNDKDVCPEKKVMGIKVSDIPQGHPLRHLYPGKFH